MDSLAKNKLIQTVWQSWSVHCTGHFSCEVALSGGLDSVVLLHLMCRLRDEHGIELNAVHVHHGLQAEADTWAAFCQSLCEHLHIPLRIECVNVLKTASGIEGAARQARYAMFSGSLKPIIALAHHQNDQIETFLLSMLRGGGIRGMSAMPEIRSLNENVHLWRPLLPFARKELAAYARAYDLSFVEDPSNTDTRYLRNWLRHEIIPKITGRIPAFAAHMTRNLESVQANLALVDEITANDYGKACCAAGVLNCRIWAELPDTRRNAVLYHFTQKNKLGAPSIHSLYDFSLHLSAKANGHHVWHLPQGKAHAQYGFLWAWADQDPLHKQKWLPENLVWEDAAYGLAEDDWIKNYTIRTVTPQDVLATCIGHKNVIKLLQERKIPAFIRRHWPVLADANDICRAVIGIRCDETVGIDGGKFPHIVEFDRFVTELYRIPSVLSKTWQSPT